MPGDRGVRALPQRPDTGWRARSETSTRVWSELNDAGEPVFRYTATVRAFVGNDNQPFEEKTVEGTTKREWILRRLFGVTVG